MTKEEAREKSAGIRKKLSEEYKKSASRSIEAVVLSDKSYLDAKTVFIYASVDGEPDTAGLIRDALRRGKRVLVPKCRGKRMLAVEISTAEELRPGAFGIPEPESCEDYKGSIDLAVTPCVAASREGGRLGHGMGYYDRFLGARWCRTLCLCFGKLLFDVPTDERDVKMDEVVSEEGKW